MRIYTQAILVFANLTRRTRVIYLAHIFSNRFTSLRFAYIDAPCETTFHVPQNIEDEISYPIPRVGH